MTNLTNASNLLLSSTLLLSTLRATRDLTVADSSAIFHSWASAGRPDSWRPLVEAYRAIAQEASAAWAEARRATR